MMRLDIQLFAENKVVIEAELDTKGFEAQIAELEDKLNDVEQTLSMADEDKSLFSTREVKEMEVEAEKLRNKLVSLRKKQDEINSKGFGTIKSSLESVGSSLNKIVHKVAKWGLAVIGVRSAYSLIRRAMSLVTSDNEVIANQMTQMRNVLASTLAPVVQNIVNLLAKIMVYVNYIYSKLFGKNLFDFSKALKSGEDSSAGIAGNLKEANKQLAKFDEMNVLDENKSSGGGGGGGATADFENIFDKLQNIEIPKWIKDLTKLLKTLKKHWKEVVIVATAFGAVLLTLKVANLVNALLGVTAISTSVMAGFALMTAGVVLLVGAIINLIANWDEMTTKEKALNIALASLGAGFIALGYAVMEGVSMATLGIGLLIAVIVALSASLLTQISTEIIAIDKIYDETVQTEELTNAKERAKTAYDNLIDAVDRQTQAQENLIETEQRNQMSGEELYNSVENGTISYKEMTKQQRETYKAYKDLIDANKNLQKANDEKIASDSRVIAQDYNVQIANDKTGKTYDDLKHDIIESYEKGEMTAQDASDSISRMMGNMSLESYQTFQEDIPEDIRSGLDPGAYKSTFDKFKDLWNNWIDGLSRNIGLNINAHVSGGGGGSGFAKGGIVVPKLASGGIISNPGRGVPLGSAIVGERGTEGVIPLTDSQQMMMLGEAIGKYITVNASITNTMNGRVISRELQKVQNQDNFAFNR